MSGEWQVTDLYIPAEGANLAGSLEIPEDARGIVVFAHGSGSSRHSPRNTYVSRILRGGRVGTLLLDLLTPQEDAVYATRFDIALLTRRLLIVTRWLKSQPRTANLLIGYFGASTGAAAALRAAASLGEGISAVVTRGGRVDLAEQELPLVKAPTLLIVGGEDTPVLELNQRAFTRLSGVRELAVIPGASHLFEEPGAIEEVARMTCGWFQKHLR